MSYIFWDPSRAIFDFPLPLIGRPILWYGFFFALGFFLGYWILLYVLKRILSDPLKIKMVADRITIYVVVGTVVGARLGDLLFYQDLSQYAHDPLGALRVWEGGLASHGGAIGIMIALYLLSRRAKKGLPKFSWLSLLDIVVIPTAFVASFIRIGNFFNQEILGRVTTLPWAVIFGHPADGSYPAPRHPVQLYESLAYLLIFVVLITLWRGYPAWRRTGKMCGLFLLLVFSFRFFVEFLKEEQSLLLSASAPLQMGQLLSLPFILLGTYFLLRQDK
ncbi:MAG: prolipoprotein diacylglyceryl transferase [Chlamydiales bacterium]|nr:prolipoprotein diacylglyceryl transferase [Chlamydiales bacterium]